MQAAQRIRLKGCGKQVDQVDATLRIEDSSDWTLVLGAPPAGGSSLGGSYTVSGRRERKVGLQTDASGVATLTARIAALAAQLCGDGTGADGVEMKAFELVRGKKAARLKLTAKFVASTGKRGKLTVRGKGVLAPAATTSTSTTPSSTAPSTTATSTTATSTTSTTTTLPVDCSTLPDDTPCDDDANPCTVDVCADGTCAHLPAASGTECRKAVDLCDVAETCDGITTECPIDAYAPAPTVCREQADACDVTDVCSGDSPLCPDAFAPASEVCRPAEGPCDEAELCPGTSGACPPDVMKSSTTVCSGADEPCELDALCDGKSPGCPANPVRPVGTVCRPVAGVCDVEDACNGTSPGCFDQRAVGMICRDAAGPCDEIEGCDGESPDCPPDLFTPASTVCRPRADDCDVTDVCSGSSADCPDAFAPPDTLCRVADGDCDVNDFCTGTSAACPPDAYDGSGSICRPASQLCEDAAVCDGSGPQCPPNPYKAAGTPCGAAIGACDLPDTCSGDSALCPDALQPSGFPCRPAAGDCDLAETCSGSSKSCPFIDVMNFSCQPSQGPCDVVDTCSPGTNPNYPGCPVDTVAPNGTLCEPPPDSLMFDCQEYICDGSDYLCDQRRNRGTTYPCRPAVDECDVAELCGSPAPINPNHNPEFPNCPSTDTRQPDGTPCHTDPEGLTGTCQGGTCVATLCKYDVDCPDGEVCDTATWHCLPKGVGSGQGALCTGVMGSILGNCGGGLFCCAGMQGDGVGGYAAAGQTGRCAECCGNQQSTIDDCADSQLECCDGRCINVSTSDDHCGGCTPRSNQGFGTGYDCQELENGCYRNGECEFGGCIFDSVCTDPGDSCFLPTDPNCPPGDLFCFATSVDPACSSGWPDFPDCGYSCVPDPLIVPEDCLNDACDSDDDCCEGRVCLSTCSTRDYGFCFSGSTCQAR